MLQQSIRGNLKNEVCPARINIPIALQIYNQCKENARTALYQLKALPANAQFISRAQDAPSTVEDRKMPKRILRKYGPDKLKLQPD